MSRQRHISAQLVRVLWLIFIFVVTPSAGLLSVGVLVLVLGHAPKDIVLGVLILSLVATMAMGTAAMLIYVLRSATLARLQTDFVTRVSHDLRTPLTSIRLFAETLQLGRAADEETRQACLSHIEKETARLASMIERLLAWARMEAGRRAYEPRPMEVREVVEVALETLAPYLAGTAGIIEHHVPDDLPVVNVDREALVEALVNLVQNALKYAGTSQPVVITAARRRRWVTISVADSGPGIPKEEHRRVFQKFYRGASTKKMQVPGTGLGLAIVEHIVRGHRGRMMLTSEPGRGATFTIHLPTLKEHRGREAAHHRGRPVDPAGAAHEPADRGVSAPGSA